MWFENFSIYFFALCVKRIIHITFNFTHTLFNPFHWIHTKYIYMLKNSFPQKTVFKEYKCTKNVSATIMWNTLTNVNSLINVLKDFKRDIWALASRVCILLLLFRHVIVLHIYNRLHKLQQHHVVSHHAFLNIHTYAKMVNFWPVSLRLDQTCISYEFSAKCVQFLA